MGLLIVNAKVKLMAEEDMERWEIFDGAGLEAPSAKWVWRNIVIRSGDIKNVTAYNSTKCLIVDYNGEETMVKETLEDVFIKWKAIEDAEKEEKQHIPQDIEHESEEEDD